MGKTKGPTFLSSCLVVLLEEQVAWALGEERQAHQLDQGGDSNHSKQVWPGALLRGKEGLLNGRGLQTLRWGWAERSGFLQKVPPSAAE